MTLNGEKGSCPNVAQTHFRAWSRKQSTFKNPRLSGKTLGAGDGNRTRVLSLGTAPRPFFGTFEISRKVLKTRYLLGKVCE
jgi:hypothetical protein